MSASVSRTHIDIQNTLETANTVDRADIKDTLGIADTANTLDRVDMEDKMNIVNPAAHRISALPCSAPRDL